MPLRLVLIEDHQALREGLELLLGRGGIGVLGAPETITTRIGSAMNKLEANNTRVHAIAIALREGFISAPTSL